MRIPNPIATITTEAYLAYRAGFLAQADLKEKLYHPYLHIDGWLAYWTGLTDTYPTDKNGDPECLTDEEAYIAYLAGVTSEYPEALKDPADVRVASYLRYLVSARYGRPDYPVTREEFYLSMMKPRFIPSGDPSSSIELDGTVEAPFVDVKMYGDTFQQTYSGKSLINWGAGSSQDITIEQNDDGSISISGVPSTTYPNITNRPSVSLPAGTYTVSIGNAVQNVVNIAGTYQGSNRIALSTIPIGSTSATITTTDTLVEIDLWFTAVVGTAVDFTIYPMVETGSTATSYEPYVGGTPAPNPDYPQEVQTVTGEQTVSVTGKNLLPKIIATYSSSGVDWVFTDSLITGNGTATGNWVTIMPITDFEAPLKPGTYTFSIPQALAQNLQLKLYDADGTQTDNNIVSGNTSVTFTTTTTNTRFRLLYRATSQTVDVSISNQLQLEAGSTATAYTTYQGQSYTVSLGSTELCKLGDYQDYIYKSGDDWYVHKAIGKITYTGDSSENWQYSSTSNGPFRIAIPNAKYYTSNDVAPLVYCDYYTPIKWTVISSTTYAVTAFNNNVLPFRNMDIADLDAWKAWLGTHNLIVYYPFATPADTIITDENLLAQLDALKEGGSYNDKTYITVSATDPNLPGLLYVEAAV